MKNKKLFALATCALFSLASCGEKENNNNNKPNNPTPPVVQKDIVPVFVMSGQSNMEGSTYWRVKENNQTVNILEREMTTLGEDYSVIGNGVENVVCSYYGFYHPSGWAQAHTASTDKSTPQARLTPNFKPTTVGMGVGDGGNDDYFGPEIGLSYKLSQEYDGDNPIHLIKCAFSGSGFSQGTLNWRNQPDENKTEEQNASSSLYYLLKRYTDNCLKVIEDEGKTPVIKGFLWHQGESDTNNNDYDAEMLGLIAKFRSDYAQYAEDEEGDNIAFIDCTIYDGAKNTYGSASNVANGINKKKQNVAEASENNYLIDGSFSSGKGLSLEIGDAAKGGYNTYHYNTKDAFILGEAYADIILENDLLD